jgi:hypothetical protein
MGSVSCLAGITLKRSSIVPIEHGSVGSLTSSTRWGLNAHPDYSGAQS